MRRVTITSLFLGFIVITARDSPTAAWPLRATITDPAGRRVTFHALSSGGDLIVPSKLMSETTVIRHLARGDTLSATTPAQYPLDLSRGPVVFFTSGRDSIRVVVGRNPFGATDRVSGEGRRVTVWLMHGAVAIDGR
jgi:hypothetical protein